MAKVDPLNWCRACGKASVIRFSVCPQCGQTPRWAEECPDPAVAYELSFNDSRFLKALRIDPECEVMRQ